jgi:phage baseplate assembly protein W
MDITTASVIGQGIKFPLTFNENVRSILLELSSDHAVIHESIFIILNTKKGERYNNPEFGSLLYTLVFEMNDSILQDSLYLHTVDALKKWEKRITITKVQFMTNPTNEHYLGIVIHYTINKTHEPGVYVFPFIKGGQPFDDLLQV